MATKNSPPTSNKPVGSAGSYSGSSVRPPTPPKPKPVQSGTSHWLDKLDDVKVGQPEQPPPRPKLPNPPAQRDNRGGGYRNPMTTGPGNYREDRGPGNYREDRGPGNYREDRGPGRGPGSYRPSSPTGHAPSIGQRPRQPMEGGLNRGPRPDKAPHRPGGPRDGARPGHKPRGAPKPPATPRPKREKTPPPPPFVPTDEQIKQIEERYLELAASSEFDGIRTQISKELNIPKKAVKKVIKDLRGRQNIPSWWELQTYKGSAEELEKIKETYLPYLPVPPVGIHKIISEKLDLKPGTIYQAIKSIRQEMNLPQYNDPTLHEEELANKTHAQNGQSAQPAQDEQNEPADKAEQASVDASASSETSAETQAQVESAPPALQEASPSESTVSTESVETAEHVEQVEDSGKTEQAEAESTASAVSASDTARQGAE